jgi:hypothetical protein
MRREETAAIRNMLNTAKLMEENEMLWKLTQLAAQMLKKHLFVLKLGTKHSLFPQKTFQPLGYWLTFRL